MECYIHRSYQISATPDPDSLTPKMIEPDYTEKIDLRSMRRMSPLLLMGVYSALQVLPETDIKVAGIISATGLGCIRDTYNFLTKMVEQQEQGISPTAFIQSTHNTLAGNLGILIQNHGYNITWTQGFYSFYSALRDGIRQTILNPANPYLLISSDEMTEDILKIIGRMPCGDRQTTWMPCSSAFLIGSAPSGKNDWRIIESRLLAVNQFEGIDLNQYELKINANIYLNTLIAADFERFSIRSGNHFTMDGSALAYAIDKAESTGKKSICVIGGDYRRVHYLIAEKV